jgi:tRNA (guanine-N1)-methyltransferase
MRFDVLTLFPEILQGYLTQSILKLALDSGLVEIHLWNVRDWAKGKHHSVDDRPFGGGPGMVMMPEPVYDAVSAVQAMFPGPGELIMLTPAGSRLTQDLVRSWPALAGWSSCADATRALTSAYEWACDPERFRSETLSATAARCRPWS